MGAIISRCLEWRCDPDPISCQQLCASANNSRSCSQRQQLQHQQKKVPQPRPCAASSSSGSQRLLDSRKFYQRPGLQGSADTATPSSPRSKDPGFTGLCSASASPASDRPPTPKFLLGSRQGQSPDGSNAAYGSCSFTFPQQHQQQVNNVHPSNPYCGDLRYPQQQQQQPPQQQHLPRHPQEDEEFGSRVKRTFSLRLSSRNCDTAATPRKAHSIRSKCNARPRDN